MRTLPKNGHVFLISIIISMFINMLQVIVAAQALSKQILEEGEPAVERYINEFLKAGSSDYPIEVLKKAGVDMTSKQPIEEAMEVFEQKLNAFEKLVKEK